MSRNTTPIYERGVPSGFREEIRRLFNKRVVDEVHRRMFDGEGTGRPTGILTRLVDEYGPDDELAREFRMPDA